METLTPAIHWSVVDDGFREQGTVVLFPEVDEAAIIRDVEAQGGTWERGTVLVVREEPSPTEPCGCEPYPASGDNCVVRHAIETLMGRTLPCGCTPDPEFGECEKHCHVCGAEYLHREIGEGITLLDCPNGHYA